MTHVYKRRGEHIDKLWRRFEKSCKKAGIALDARRHEAFSSKGEQSRQKSREAAWRSGSNER
jgi:ribosomal protein S21